MTAKSSILKTVVGEREKEHEKDSKFDIFHISKETLVSKGQDENGKIMAISKNLNDKEPSKDHEFPRLHYYVYDVIKDEKKYGVYRLENM